MISVGDAVVKLGLDISNFKKGMTEAANSTKQSLEKIGAEARATAKANEEATKNIAAGWKKVMEPIRATGIAITAVGVAGLKMVSDARKMNAELAQVGITVGMTTAELRDMALELSNVTFRLKSVISTLTILSRAGVTNKEDMKATANAFDTLADAIGSSAEVVAEQLIPAFGIFGLELPKTAEETDKLTWLVKNTLINMEDFASVMEYVAIYGSELNVTLDDMIAIMFELNERHITGAAATRLFRTAVSQAVSEGISLNEALNINNDTIDQWTQKISVDAVGASQAYADAANEQYGIIGKLASAWEDLAFSVGSFLTPLEPVFGLMSAIGPILLALSTSSIPQLIANIKNLVTSFIGLAVAAGRAIAGLIVQAAAAIWAWAGAIPIAGIALGIAGVAALTAGIIIARNKAQEAIAGLAEGGIVKRPTMALIGEAGPEAVIPLSQGSFPGEVHIHVGNFMGDEMSMRQFVRRVDQMLKEETRRNFFSQVQSGYRYGTSSR
jgi:hypothetical protein